MKDHEGLDSGDRVGPWGTLRAPIYVPSDADLAYLGMTEHQIGLINAIPPGEGQDIVRCEVYSEQARILMEHEGSADFPANFGDLI